MIKSFSFLEWMSYLEKFYLNIKCNNINNTIYIAKKLGILKLNRFVYIVGGTNGKGTTCFVLEKILLEHGYRVGLYTSPHLFRYTERVRINGHELEERLHVDSFINIERVRGALLLTYHDFITLSALYLFKHRKLDVIILEVGLGGRFDATNIIDPDISIITNIAMDHMNILGKNRDLIGIEKSGILRNNKVAIISSKNIPNIVKCIIRKNRINAKWINQDWFYKKYDNFWDFISNDFCFLDLPLPKVSLINVATALAAISESTFSIKKNVVKNCIDKMSLCGRFQVYSYHPIVILDVAHNNHATQHLSRKLTNLKGIGKIYAIIGVLQDKDILSIVSPLISIVDFWYCTELKTQRSISAKKIVKHLPIHFSKAFSSVRCAWKEVKSMVKIIDVIVIFGSFYIVREMYDVFKDINK
ncbi:MAG: bifunctional tetrahydrofolate synthase/dihydrofolate synthase [Buchnera aphidicola (Meitanaphis elongallis)]